MAHRPILIFDLAETLIGGMIGIEDVIATRESADVDSVGKTIGSEPLWGLFRGQLTERQYFDHVSVIGAWTNTSFETFSRQATSMFEHTIPGMPELVSELADHCDLYLLSDHVREWTPAIRARHSFLGKFRKLYFSYEIGAVKRDGTPFNHVLHDIGARPEQVAFIDDSARNIEVARRLGLKTFHFKGRSSVESGLRDWIGSALAAGQG